MQLKRALAGPNSLTEETGAVYLSGRRFCDGDFACDRGKNVPKVNRQRRALNERKDILKLRLGTEWPLRPIEQGNCGSNVSVAASVRQVRERPLCQPDESKEAGAPLVGLQSFVLFTFVEKMPDTALEPTMPICIPLVKAPGRATHFLAKIYLKITFAQKSLLRNKVKI